jgi:hypothetical protein
LSKMPCETLVYQMTWPWWPWWVKQTLLQHKQLGKGIGLSF